MTQNITRHTVFDARVDHVIDALGKVQNANGGNQEQLKHLEECVDGILKVLDTIPAPCSCKCEKFDPSELRADIENVSRRIVAVAAAPEPSTHTRETVTYHTSEKPLPRWPLYLLAALHLATITYLAL